MDYKEVSFFFERGEDFFSDVLASELGEIGYESFVQKEKELLAYCPTAIFCEDKIQKVIEQFPFSTKITYKTTEIKAQNWNQEWESNSFEPISINAECIIHHPKHIVQKYKYDLLIEPHMAFGTGYHETTCLIIKEMLKQDFSGKSVLDMGCGTGVLSILASKLNAKSVTAIDIDRFSFDNTIHNGKLNNINNLDVKLGDATLLLKERFDVILANINRNILIQDMATYSTALHTGGEIFFSGFYTQDIPFIEKSANENGLNKKYETEKNSWAMLCFEKC